MIPAEEMPISCAFGRAAIDGKTAEITGSAKNAASLVRYSYERLKEWIEEHTN